LLWKKRTLNDSDVMQSNVILQWNAITSRSYGSRKQS